MELHLLEARPNAKSFYQTNSDQALELYKITRAFADLQGDELVYDLYTGTGTIAQFVAKNAMKVMEEDYAPMTDGRASDVNRMQSAANLLYRFYLETRSDNPLPNESLNVFAKVSGIAVKVES